MLTQSVTERLKTSSDWQLLQDHILSEYEKLRRNDDIDFSDKEKAAILGQGRQEAARVLMEILEPFFTGEDVVEDKASETRARTGVEE